ncbi:MAG: transcription antitermination factor NusB [Lachnospira sp.]|nr:transcription antitermination factor NusB [Lachnospira sp.]
MTRSIMREHIFKILFRAMFHDANELDEQIRFYFDEFPSMDEKEMEYISTKAKNILKMVEELDTKINSVSDGWPTSRLGKAELSIMRLAVYEMLFDDDIPVNVAINEAIELAKKYGAENAPSFINGVLAKLTK